MDSRQASHDLVRPEFSIAFTWIVGLVVATVLAVAL